MLAMNLAILLLLVALSVEINGQSHGDLFPCPDIMVNLSRKPIEASSTCGDSNISVEYCYDDNSKMQCNICENETEFSARNAVDENGTTHWISRPGVEAVNLTVNLLQVWNVYDLYCMHITRTV